MPVRRGLGEGEKIQRKNCLERCYDGVTFSAAHREETMSRMLAVLMAALLVIGCSSKSPKEESPAGTAQPATVNPEEPLPPEGAPANEAELPVELRAVVDRAFTGDFKEMVEHRLIRAGVPYNRTFYFVDKGAPRGLAYEYLKICEDELNKKFNTGLLKIHVVAIPMLRDQLLPALQSGKVDIVVAQMTVTPEREKLVDFSNPTRKNISEVVVTGPGAPSIATTDDLSDKPVFVRKSSSYYTSLLTLNEQLVAKRLKPVDIRVVDESLEDDDLLEMVNAGLIPATVVDDYYADFWKKMFPDMIVHNTLTLRTGGNLAVAMRKNSPQLAAELNGFIAKFGLSSGIGRTLNQRYLESTRYARNAASAEERRKFQTLVALFKKYGEEYQFDYLMMAAQGFQESRLDQDAKSQVGAIGVMQVMPATGREQKVGDITQLEPNIHAGVKYMRFMRDQYFADEPMNDVNKALFTFASYNAGPGRIRQLRRETEKRGLNPNIWFGNVEQIVSERIGRETVTYVSNIYKYYLAYRLITDQNAMKQDAKAAIGRSGMK
jgi:membrane-bound lytic murein transglycosylase MltF